jgi:hypothetical protein
VFPVAQWQAAGTAPYQALLIKYRKSGKNIPFVSYKHQCLSFDLTSAGMLVARYNDAPAHNRQTDILCCPLELNGDPAAHSLFQGVIRNITGTSSSLISINTCTHTAAADVTMAEIAKCTLISTEFSWCLRLLYSVVWPAMTGLDQPMRCRNFRKQPSCVVVSAYCRLC